MKKVKGFTLIEMLVVIAIVSILGVLLLTIFTRSLKGSNKSQIIGAIKQNAQAVLENMDKTIRNSDNVVCYSNLSNPGPTIVTIKDGCYTRYRFIAPSPIPNPTQNGQIQQDNPQLDPDSPCVVAVSPAPPPQDVNTFVISVCNDPMINPTILTDTNTQKGVSVKSAIFGKNPSAGFKDSVTIQFEVGAGEKAPSAVVGQIDTINFQTTIQLR